MSYVVLDVIEAGMDTNDEVRRRRLVRLCEDQKCGLVEIAGRAGLSWASLDQIQKRVLLPAKKGGTRSERSLGDLAARKIETAYELPAGWLDWPFEAVDYASYAALSDIDKGAVQARMMAAIEDRLQSPIYGVSVNSDRAGKHHTKVLSSIENSPPGYELTPALEKFFSSTKGVDDGVVVPTAKAKKRHGDGS